MINANYLIKNYFQARKHGRDLLGIKDFIINKGDFEHKFVESDVEEKMNELRNIIEEFIVIKRREVFAVSQQSVEGSK